MAAVRTPLLLQPLMVSVVAWLALAGFSMQAQAQEIKPARASKAAMAVAAEPASPAFRIEGRQRKLALLAPEVNMLKGEDETRDITPGVPLRYGVVRTLGGLKADGRDGIGRWRVLADGSWRWTLEVAAPGARSLELNFSSFRLPFGAKLVIRSAAGKLALPPLTDADNPASGHLRTAMLESNRAVLELSVPATARGKVELTLASAVWGYRSPFDVAQAKSGSCNIDVACPEGDAWREQISSVAMYLSNGYACTGTLIATGDRAADISQPRFATAHHCVSTAEEAEGMVLYWGYESPTCRAPGSTASGQALPYQGNVVAVQTGGANLLATNRDTDVTAVQLNTPVPAEAQAYYSGWDRSGTAPTGAVAIHHPNGDEKRISFDFDPLTTQNNCIVTSSMTNTHWRVSQYERGTTEQGSSGAGLWDQNSGLLVGVLSGGIAACDTPNGYDCYGRLASAWGVTSDTATPFPAAFDRSGDNPQTQPGMGACEAPHVTLATNVFVQGVRAGEPATFAADATGGSGAISFAWDLDGDGLIDRQGSAHVTATYPAARSTQVRVYATDAQGCRGQASHALDVAGPKLEAQLAVTPVQVCGNGDADIDPGERWNFPVTLTNTGAVAAPAGAFALFTPSNSTLPFGPDAFGYTGTSSTQGACSYNFIDIATGEYAVAALETSVANGNTYGNLDDARSTQITLGGTGLSIYGNTVTAAVMSTNGYVSFDAAETGADWSPACGEGDFTQGAKGPQLRPYHDDLVINERAGAGLRYRYFATCPRPAEAGGAVQGCHVFQWTGMGYYGEDDDFEFQAIAYEQSGQVSYQYRSAASDEGVLASIGLVNAAGDDALNLSCKQANVTAQTAFCAFTPNAVPLQQALRVEKPALELPAIAAGASATVNVPLAFDASLSCDANPVLDFTAVAGATFSSVEPARFAPRAVTSGACQIVTNCAVPANNINARRGYFQNPARRGNGFASFPYGGLWFTAEPDRNTSWYVVSASHYQDNLMQTRLTHVVNTTPGDGVTMHSERAGTASIARIDENRQLFAWHFDDGRVGAELQQALHANLPHPKPNHTELWFSLQEGGWGLAVEEAIVDGAPWLGASAWLFDAAGQPRWLLVRGIAKSTAMPLYSYQPHCPGCPWIADWDASETNAGSLQLRFDSHIRGVIENMDITLPAPLEGEWKRDSLELLPITEPVQ